MFLAERKDRFWSARTWSRDSPRISQGPLTFPALGKAPGWTEPAYPILSISRSRSRARRNSQCGAVPRMSGNQTDGYRIDASMRAPSGKTTLRDHTYARPADAQSFGDYHRSPEVGDVVLMSQKFKHASAHTTGCCSCHASPTPNLRTGR